MLTQGISILTLFIIGFIVFDFILEFILDRLNDKSWELPIPKELNDIYDDKKYLQARNYHKAKQQLQIITKIISTILIIAFIWIKGFAQLHQFVANISTAPILQTLLFFGIFGIASEIIGLPFEIYGIFITEEQFGFNKMTWKTYLSDKVKGYILGILVGGLLLSLFVWFYTIAGAYFWIYAWILFTCFILFFAMFYTSLIVPLFNKLKPLEEGSLRTKIESYAKAIEFPLDNIYVIDGSKRSTKANAYFSGLGSKKTIVLYDTLIKEQSEEELVSILAHEVGHYKLKHIQKSIAISTLQMGLLLFILSIFINQPVLSEALGIQTKTPIFHLGLITFSLLYTPISMLTGIFMNILSRKNEFEADSFAKKTIGTEVHLISALKKLSANNLSNLNPDKWYVFFHYSHPPLLARIKNLSI